MSEIQHSPSNASPDLEFVEIRNIGNTTQAMSNWRLRGDADFDFTTESLAAGGFLVLVPFAPTDNARAAAFRTAYQISNLVPLVGPWKAGDVLASTGAVTLYRAEAEPVDEPGFIPRTTEDFVNFRSSPPWPTLTTLGLSLTRRGVATHGNFGASWKNDVPTPGGYGVSYAKWNAFFFPGGGLGSQDADDFDTDGAGNNLEFTQGSDPRFGEGRVGFSPRLTQPGGPGGSTDLFTYTVALDRLGTVYQPEQSPDLITWSDSASSLISTDGDRETRQVSITISGGLPDQLFFRVRTTTAQ